MATSASAPVPAGPLRRVAGAAGAVLLLASLTGGLPLALVRLAGNPLPADMPTVAGLWSTLTSPDDGRLFLGGLAVAGWLAWACFTGSVVLELVARLADRRPPAIPGLRGPQRFASVLVTAVAAVTVAPTFMSTSAAVVPAPPTATAALAIPADPLSEVDSEIERPLHLVARGEGLLDLQDRYGVPWHRIAEANLGATQADGRSLQPGQTRVYPGWQLRIPAATATTVGAATPVDSSEQVEEPAAATHDYQVAEGDWMWHIADRYLGDPERYRDIAALNPAYADRHGNFPDHIEPGWTLTLPEDVVDSGPIRHATGAVAGPAEPAEPGTVAGFGAAPEPPDAAAPPEATGEPRAGFGAAPEQPAGEEHDAAAEADLERLAPATLAGAGLLTALVLGAATLHRYRRHQHHRSGFRFASPAARRLEKALRAAQQPLDTARLDAALRQLAAGLADRTGAVPDIAAGLADGTGAVPDIAGALVDEGSVHLLLSRPCPDPPAPWQSHGDRWTLPAGAELPPPATAPLAPLPALAAVGSQAGIHLLLDLERLGFLTVFGDPGRALDLLRYLAAELAGNSWSDTAEVLLTGFPAAETEQLVALNPDRVRVEPSVPDAVARLRHRIASARATLGHTGVPDPLTGRIRGVAGDAWMPQILVAAGASPADLAALSELERELDGAARCAVAVATTDADPPAAGQWRVTVTADGVVHVRLPFLRASLAGAALPARELAALAETVRAARTAPPVPVPPAPESFRWAAGTDAAGAVALTDRPALRRAALDPRLDDDLAAWQAAASDRPRIGILGPVSVDAFGPVPETRRRLHAELIVFLAQRAGRGADAAMIDAALWPDTRVADPARQRAISRARHWLGTGPGGAPWLPDLGPDLRYRLAEGYLLDWHLFRRLRTRGETRDPDGAADLRAALALVRGVPLEGADRPAAPGTRNPYPWLAESDIHPDHLVAAIIDTAHQLAELCLAAGDPDGARWAVRQAWLADPGRGYDQPWRDLLRAEHADGRSDRLRAVLAELMEVRDAEAAEDLSPDTYSLISCWPPNVLVPTG
jgi:LysM repeat protein